MILPSLAGVLLLAAGNGPPPTAVVFAGPIDRATVAIPAGWVVDLHRAGEELRLVRSGARADPAPPSIRVLVESRGPGEEDQVRDAVFARFQRPRVWGRLGPSVWTADERRLWVRHYVADDGQPSHVVTLVEEPQVLVIFTLEAFSLKALQERSPEFTALVASYRSERTDPAGRLAAVWKNKHVQEVMLLLLPLAFLVTLWSGLWWLVGLVGGWPFLARAYRARQAFDGPTTSTGAGFVGRSGYKGMTVGANHTGLYVKNPLLLRPGHAPLFFPWSEVKDVTQIRGSAWTGGPKLVFRFRQSRVDVKLPPDLQEWLRDQAGPAWPGVR